MNPDKQIRLTKKLLIVSTILAIICCPVGIIPLVINILSLQLVGKKDVLTNEELVTLKKYNISIIATSIIAVITIILVWLALSSVVKNGLASH